MDAIEELRLPMNNGQGQHWCKYLGTWLFDKRGIEDEMALNS
jgi:hypothetical protein